MNAQKPKGGRVKKQDKENRRQRRQRTIAFAFNLFYTSLLGDHSEREPPDPIPNSEVKPLSADDSVAVCHAKVGNCQALNLKTQLTKAGFFFAARLTPSILWRTGREAGWAQP